MCVCVFVWAQRKGRVLKPSVLSSQNISPSLTLVFSCCCCCCCHFTILATSIPFRVHVFGCALCVCVRLKIAWKCLHNRQIKLLKNYSSWNLKRLKLGQFLGLTLLLSVLIPTSYILHIQAEIHPFLFLYHSSWNLLILPLDAFNFYKICMDTLS